MTGKRHGFHTQWRVAFDEHGLLVALYATLTSDGGWSLDLSEPVMTRALCHVDNAYWIPHVRVNGRIARTHKTSQTAFRGFGGPQGMLVIEDVLGRCAPRLGIDPADLRRRNFYREGQQTPYGQVVRHPERVVTCWEQVLTTGDVARRRELVAAHNATHEHTKRAIAVTPVKFGIAFNFTAFNQGGALVHVYKDGSVLVNHGGTEMGQGLHTKMLQVAATALGVPFDLVRLAPTRTDKVPNTSATAASSGADLNGGAVLDACTQILDRLRPVAAELLGGGPADIHVEGGWVRSGDSGDHCLAWADLVAAAYLQRVQLWAAGFHRTEGLHWDSTTMQGSPFKYFSYGAAATEVEVDGFTGAYRVRRVDIVHDVGDSLSPLVDIGQVEGAFVQGAGWLTLEDLRWDESDSPTRGRLATGSASTYKLPSLSEMPDDFRVALLERAHEDGAVYGSKAVGEPPLMLAFSVREALRQAAAAFGPAGVAVDLASPATPEAVFWAVEQARGGAVPPMLQPVVEGAPGVVPDQPDVDAHPLEPASEALLPTPGRGA
jgi:xanthine dehydrogenase large subunit